MTNGDRNRIACFVLAVGLILPWANGEADDGNPTDLDLLSTWMVGTFSSAAQAAGDPDFFDLSLHMASIWTDRADGRWLYVEQAVSEHEDRPYRQRVYRLVELVPGLFEYQVFTLPDPAAVIGAWMSNEPLDELNPDDLEERDGCAILLRRRDDSFVGSTLASLCTSSLRGASYATSEVIITPDGLVSWDRGFSANGGQVWGAVKGGYVFDRIVDDDPASEAGAVTETAKTDAGTGTETEAATETGADTETEAESESASETETETESADENTNGSVLR
jgi:CpeT/CpcT family (DUF1001)